MIVQPCDPAAFKSCKVIFSGLDSNVAGDIEDAFRRAEFPVFSNAKNYRMVPNVPLVVPMVNASHLTAIEAQKLAQGLNSGFIVTNANCSTTGLVVALKPLHDAFCLDQVHVTVGDTPDKSILHFLISTCRQCKLYPVLGTQVYRLWIFWQM